MGRRSRKRSAGDGGAVASPPREPAPPSRPAAPPRAQGPASRRARRNEAPPAPWSPFPLVELTILFGIVLVVLGAIGVADRRGLFLVCGIALIYLATIELSLREHFSGYRSHSTLLAAVAAIAVAAGLYFGTAWPYEVIGAVSLAIFAAAFATLRAAFRRRTGGLGFRA